MNSGPVIPLFPLNTVLFPGMVLPLHIFEPRYRSMVRDVQRNDGTFGVVLISQGLEVGGSALPHTVGTLARITRIDPLDEGRMHLLALGIRRFEVVRLLPTGTPGATAPPYLRGEVRYLDDSYPDSDLPLAGETLRLFRRYLDALRQGGANIPDVSHFHPDPLTLSWTVAATLRQSLEVQQELLQIDDTVVRLRREVTLLQQQIRSLETPMRRSQPFSLN